MAHANRGCKWYINKSLLSQAKLTGEENMHTHITMPLIEWTEIKILLPQAISGGLWKRNCNKLVQKKLNQLQTGEQTHWQGGNRGVSIKNQSYVWHAAKLRQSYAWNWRKSRKKILVLVRLWTAANGSMSSIANQELSCLWHFHRVCGSRDTLGMAQPGAALGSEQLWVCRGSETTSFRPRSQERQGGKKKSQFSQNKVRGDWKKYSVHHLKDPGNRNTDSGCKQSYFYSDLSL